LLLEQLSDHSLFPQVIENVLEFYRPPLLKEREIATHRVILPPPPPKN
jgi:hypothetical protein